MDRPYRQLIDIGDRAVCVRVRGSGPTVVLEAGGAGGAGEGTTGAYGDLEERLASFATVLTYDRAGSGCSDGPAHRDVAAMADDLGAIIQTTGCVAPVVVVGWTLGGLVAEMFAVRHPDKVAGLVLLNPTEMPTESRLSRYRLLAYGLVSVLVSNVVMRLGVFRTRTGRKFVRRRTASAGASTDALDYVEHFLLHPPRARWSYVPVLPQLFGGYARETAAAVRTAASLPDVPVRVLVPQNRGGRSRGWVERLDVAHRALAQRFPQGELITVDQAGYYFPIDRPDVVIETVRDVLGLDSDTHMTTT
ncbi:alpha/beta fold hydrolase [Mycobacterium interjectum]|uniref:alpha/beta fold hydrolase n=1 Tax=Mycobacterium interjectum TaxID=33895 RepID=UPI000A06532F|nr:alpha/beta fold hydrolase [Mycobacterium interjectum]MCV7089693.1 alpha/beta fold hydrolase [Mycobacterium interjectum]